MRARIACKLWRTSVVDGPRGLRVKVSFLAVDSTGEHEVGESRQETNPITLRYDYAYRDGSRRVMLEATPKGAIRSEVELDAATTRSALNAAAKRLMRARAELKRLQRAAAGTTRPAATRAGPEAGAS